MHAVPGDREMSCCDSLVKLHAALTTKVLQQHLHDPLHGRKCCYAWSIPFPPLCVSSALGLIRSTSQLFGGDSGFLIRDIG